MTTIKGSFAVAASASPAVVQEAAPDAGELQHPGKR